MPLILQSKTLLLNEVDFEDQSFSLAPDEEQIFPEGLIADITRTGLLHPPILRKKNDRRYQIVAGRKRLAIVRDELDCRSCLCLIMPNNATEMECLKVSLADADLAGNLSVYSKALFIKHALEYENSATIIREYLPRLKLPPRQETLNTYAKLADIELPIARAIHIGDIDGKAALSLSELSFRDRMALYEVIDALKLSVGNQRKIVETCRELAKRNNREITTILSDDEFTDILEHSDANIPQKAANFMKHLARLRSPRLSQAEEEFNRYSARLQLPKNFDLKHSPSFEQDHLTLTITFKNKDEFEEKWQNIKE